MTTAEDIKRLADTYADGPHTEGYFGAHRNALHAAIDAMAAQRAAAEAEVAQMSKERAELAATVIEMRQDAMRYRQMRELGSQLKLYVYQDEEDPDSGGWLYKPTPEFVDLFADELVSKFGNAAMKKEGSQP